jgi:hypothetical protein
MRFSFPQVLPYFVCFGFILAPLVHANVDKVCSRSLLTEGGISIESFPHLKGHVIGSTVLLPGAGLLKILLEQLALKALPGQGPSVLSLKNVRISAPVHLSDAAGISRPAFLSNHTTAQDGDFALKLTAGDKTHASAKGIIGGEFPPTEDLDPETLFGFTEYKTQTLYTKLWEAGLVYKDPFKPLVTLGVMQNYALGTLKLHPSVQPASSVLMDETILDGCLHALAAIYFTAHPDHVEKLAVPVAFNQVYFNPAVLKDAPTEFVCQVKTRDVPTVDQSRITFDLTLRVGDDDAGTPFLIIKNGTAMRMTPAELLKL